MRSTLCRLALLIAGMVSATTVSAQEMRVTLLGTGSPPPTMARFGPSTLVQTGDQTLVFDAGRGATQRLSQLGIPFSKIDAVFLTHLHSDHTVGLPDLWLTGWVIARRDSPLNIFGPAGTTEMSSNLEKAFALDVHIRIEEGHQSPLGGKLLARDVVEGPVYEKNGVRVIAFNVDHGQPAFGYRIEYAGHAVVLSGDTRFSENLIKFAKDADLLVHEIVLAPRGLKPGDPGYPAFAHHTTPEQAGEIFVRTKPKLAVYSHFVNLGNTDDSGLIPRTRTVYSGPLEAGEDLMSFVIGGDVRVERRTRN